MSLYTDKTFGTTTLSCDNPACGYEQSFEGMDGYPDIKRAVQEAKTYGWIVKFYKGEFYHYCDKGCLNAVNVKDPILIKEGE